MVVKGTKELFREAHITRWTPDVDNGEKLAEGVPGDEKVIAIHHRKELVNAGPSGVTSDTGFGAVVLLQDAVVSGNSVIVDDAGHLAKEVFINVKSVVDNGDENLSKTIPCRGIWDVVSSAEELLQDVSAVERSVVADDSEELARPFSSGGRSIIVGYARALDDVVSVALLVRKVSSGRADFDVSGAIGPDEFATSVLVVQEVF
jgi:hypothetical protein